MVSLPRPDQLEIGKTDVNILVLTVVTEKFRVPLMWTLLSHSGNSTTAQRIELMRRYLARFDAFNADFSGAATSSPGA